MTKRRRYSDEGKMLTLDDESPKDERAHANIWQGQFT
jgi:hypothetical protein